MTKGRIDMCTTHPERRAINNGQCRLCRDQSEMRNRWKEIRKALRIAARYGSKSEVGISTPARPEQQLIITVTLQAVPFTATRSHGSSVPITMNTVVH